RAVPAEPGGVRGGRGIARRRRRRRRGARGACGGARRGAGSRGGLVVHRRSTPGHGELARRAPALLGRRAGRARGGATGPGDDAGVLFVACGGGSSHPAAAPPTSSTRPATPTTLVVQDAKLTASDFANINKLTRVGDHFVGNLRGHLAQALAVARSANGGTYP